MLKYQVVRLGDCIFYCRYHRYHRKNSPALIFQNSYIAYYEYNEYHRIGGPAIIWGDSVEDYYIRGIQYVEI